MSVMSGQHKRLDDDTRSGLCSALMWWSAGSGAEAVRHDGSEHAKHGDAGFCDEIAYGLPSQESRRSGVTVPGLACPRHGGPDEPQPTARESMELAIEAIRSSVGVRVSSMHLVDAIEALIRYEIERAARAGGS